VKFTKGKEVYIITAVVAVVLIVAWYFLLLSPMRSKLSDLDSQVVAQQAALVTAQQEVARLESYKKTAPQSRAEIVRLGKMLPESEGIPSLIIELTRTAEASGVDLNSITRGATQPGVPFGLQTVTLQVTGRFFDIEDFLYRLESYVAFRNAGFRVTGRLLEVTTLSMTGGAVATTSSSASPPLTVSVTLNAYLWAVLQTTTFTLTGTGMPASTDQPTFIANMAETPVFHTEGIVTVTAQIASDSQSALGVVEGFLVPAGVSRSSVDASPDIIQFDLAGSSIGTPQSLIGDSGDYYVIAAGQDCTTWSLSVTP